MEGPSKDSIDLPDAIRLQNYTSVVEAMNVQNELKSSQRLPVDLLRPFPSELMKAWKVGKDVGNVKNDNPSLCVESLIGVDEEPEPEKKEEPPAQGGLFG